MIGIALLLAAAAVAWGVAKWLNLPAIPFLLLAGVLVSATGVLLPAMLEDGVVLGLTFLVFVAGLELNPRRVGTQTRAALRVGIAQFVLLGLAGFALSLALGFDAQTSVYLALALTASSTLVVVRLLKSRQQLFEPFGRLVLGVLLLQDLLIILLIPVVTRLPLGIIAVLTGVAGTLTLLGVAFLCLRWIVPYLLLRLESDEESLLLAVLAVLFLFVGLADVLQLPVVAGAFLAGFALSAFPLNGIVRGQLDSLSDFFLAVFFTALGGFLLLPTPLELLQALALALLVVVVTPPLVTVMAERAGLSARPAIESGLLLAQTSEFSLIVGLQALAFNQVAPHVVTIIALVTVLTMVLTPFLATDRATWWLMGFHPLRTGHGPRTAPSGHILLLGCGENGMPLLETLLGAGHEVVVVDDDPAIIGRLRQGDIPCLRGDASDYAILRAAGAGNARIIISTIRRPTENQTVLEFAGDTPVLARVFSTEDANLISRLGGQPILSSEAAARDFLRWFDRAGDELATSSDDA